MMKNEVKISNVPCMDVGRVIRILSDAYISLIENDLPLRTMPSVMLWGPPGVGKSQAVRQMADIIQRKTGKETRVTDVRLLLFNPIDLRGIPTANEDRTLAVWLRPQIFQMDDDRDVVNILFLDEISAAPQSVQAAAYQIALDRTVGEHRLPENCIVIAAGNRVTDKSVAYKMPRALANRLMHIEVEASFNAWKKWAMTSGISPLVVGYLSNRPDVLLCADTAIGDNLAYATPRTWEMVSNTLNYIEADIDKAYPLIGALVGLNLAGELRNWIKVKRNIPSMEKIFDGEEVEVPQTADVMYVTISAMTAYAKEHREDMERIRNSIVYGYKLPPDFSVALMKNYMSIEEGYKIKLMKIPEFFKWMQKKGSLLNGII